MATSIVLITGATGFIGFRILLAALDAGYRVRTVVRSAEKSTKILSNPKVKEHAASGRLTSTIVTDFSLTDAWKEALKDVNYIIHAASPLPLPSLDPMKDIYQPSTKGSTNLLEAALKIPSIKRIILTSSIVATMPLPPRNKGPYTSTTRYPTPPGPFEDVYDAYQASKMHLLNLSHSLVEEHHPSFDVINIFPGYVFGKNEMATSPKGMFTSSNAVLLALLMGRDFGTERTAGAAHIDDIAQVHIQAMDQKIAGNEDYGVSVPMIYNDTIQIAKQHFPEQFEKGLFKTSGNQPSEVVEWDASTTESVFNMRFKGFETMVVDVVSQYLDLSRQEKIV